MAQRIPFDDRPNQQATIDDISPSLVREYLVTVESELLDEFDKVALVEIYRSMDLLQGTDEIHPAFRSEEGQRTPQRIDNMINTIYALISEGVNEDVKEIIDILLKSTGLNAVEIAERIGKSLSTIERYLRILRKKEIIEFKGAPKTGGYYFTSKVADILNK